MYARGTVCEIELLNFKYKKSTPGRMDFPKCLEL